MPAYEADLERFAGYDAQVLGISVDSVPCNNAWARSLGGLSRSTIAIVSAGGVHLKDQEPFNIADELGDLTYREISPDVDSSQLMVTHHHYDHADADQDINVVFPIDVLRDLESEGTIGGIAKKHIGYMGYTMQLKAMYEGTAREIANEIDRGSRADAVVLTRG